MLPASAALANAPPWSCENKARGLSNLNEPICRLTARPKRPIERPPAPEVPIARMVSAGEESSPCSATRAARRAPTPTHVEQETPDEHRTGGAALRAPDDRAGEQWQRFTRLGKRGMQREQPVGSRSDDELAMIRADDDVAQRDGRSLNGNATATGCPKPSSRRATTSRPLQLPSCPAGPARPDRAYA